MKLRNINSDVVESPIFDALYEQIPLKHGVDYNFDSLCIEQCPEDYYWAEDYKSCTRLIVVRDKETRGIRYEVEFPAYEDGVVSQYKCDNLKEAVRVFVFTCETIGHIRSGVENVFGTHFKMKRKTNGH